MQIGIGSIGYVLGDSTPLSALKAEGSSHRDLLELAGGGFRFYRRSGESLEDLAMGAAQASLLAGGLAGRDIDALLLSTNSYKSPEFSPCFGHRLASVLGIGHVLGCFLNGCADAMLSLKTAAALVRAEEANNVLVVIVDKVCEAGVARVMPGPVVHSDGAAACVVGRNSGVYRMGRVLLFEDASAGEPGAWLRVVEAALRESEWTPGDLDLVITNNLNAQFSWRLARALDIPPAKVFNANVEEVGHCLASDILINLASVAGAETEARRILLFATSEGSCGAGTLERTERQPC